MKTKIYLGLFIIILIGSFVAAYNHAIKENGRLSQEKANLEQSLIDSEKNLKLFQDVASTNAATMLKTEKKKAVLNKYALKIAKELEILKNENSEIKKWAAVNLPGLLGNRLHDFAHNKNEADTNTFANGNATTNTRARIIVSNESLYQYSIDGVTALRSCNEDKTGFLEAYNKGKELLD